MYFKKITPTSLLTSATNVVLSIFVGFFMLAAGAMVLVKFADAYQNRDQVAALAPYQTARIHIYDGRDFSSGDDYGVPRRCVALQVDGGSTTMSDVTANTHFTYSPKSDFCQTKIGKNVQNWYLYTPAKPTSFIENVGWTVLCGGILFGFLWLLASIPAMMAAYVFPSLYGWVKVITFVLLLPVVIGFGFMVKAQFDHVPTFWNSEAGPVDTYRVFISGGKLYKAPSSMYEWSDADVGDEIAIRYR